jgi:hypothetical protein
MMDMTLSVQYRDLLIGILDYIVEVRLLRNARLLLVYLFSELQKKCPEGAIAIAHDDDLQFVENVVRPSLR